MLNKPIKLFAFIGLALLISNGNAEANTRPRPDVIINTTPASEATTISTSNNIQPRFTCESINGEYTVMYRPENQSLQAYPWATPGRLGGGWTSQKRCNEISRRLEQYREDGLKSLGVGVENNYETICVTTERNPDCRIVLTVPPGQNALLTRDLVFENIVKADSGKITEGINTFAAQNNDNAVISEIGKIFYGNENTQQNPNMIDLRPFLAPADGGNGTQL